MNLFGKGDKVTNKGTGSKGRVESTSSGMITVRRADGKTVRYTPAQADRFLNHDA